MINDNIRIIDELTDLYTQIPRIIDVEYNGAPDADDDPADYPPYNLVIKAVRVG